MSAGKAGKFWQEMTDVRSTAHELLSKYWTYEPYESGGTVFVRPEVPLWYRWYRSYLRPFPMKHFYWWSKIELGSKEGIRFRDWITHGNLNLSPEIERKVPQAFQLVNGWKISDKDLKMLSGSPLVSESGERLLVKPSFYFRAEKYVKIATPLLAVPGAAWAIIRIVEWL